MAGFVSVTVGFSAPIALSAIALGKYLAAACAGISPRLDFSLGGLVACGGAFLDRAGQRELSGA